MNDRDNGIPRFFMHHIPVSFSDIRDSLDYPNKQVDNTPNNSDFYSEPAGMTVSATSLPLSVSQSYLSSVPQFYYDLSSFAGSSSHHSANIEH